MTMLPVGGGRPFLGGSAQVKVESGTADFSVFEQQLPPGSSVPLHSHDRYDEAFYVLEGEMHFVVGDTTSVAEAGALCSFLAARHTGSGMRRRFRCGCWRSEVRKCRRWSRNLLPCSGRRHRTPQLLAPLSPGTTLTCWRCDGRLGPLVCKRSTSI
jgi:Cupin domain